MTHSKTPFTASPGEIVKLYDETDTPEPWHAHILRVLVTDEGQWVDVIAETLASGAIVAHRIRLRGPGASPLDAPQQAVAPVETGPGESHIDICAHRIYTTGASANGVKGAWMLLGQSLDSQDLPDLPWRQPR